MCAAFFRQRVWPACSAPGPTGESPRQTTSGARELLPDGQRPAHISFGRDMADNEPMTAPRKSAICDKSDVFAKALAHNGRSRGKHLAHAGPASRPFIADHDHIAFDDRAIENSG